MASGSYNAGHMPPNGAPPPPSNNMSWDATALLNPKSLTASPHLTRNGRAPGEATSRAKSWEPGAALSNPEASMDTSAPADLTPGLLAPPATPPGRPVTNGFANQLSFQFSHPAQTDLPDFSGAPYGGASAALLNRTASMPNFANGFGLGPQIERLNNVAYRSDVPQPKRRKTQTESDSMQGRGGGILGQYVKEEREQEGKAGLTMSTPGTVDLTEDDPDIMEIDKPKESPLEQEVCFGMIDGASINCHKVPAPKPGMRSLGGDDFWPQVKVVLRRKADDPTHRIQVYDHTRQVFGLVDPKISNSLAPLLDSHLGIRTDCRIPMRRKHPGEKIGSATSRNAPCQLMVYGPRRSAIQVGNHLTKSNLKLLNPARLDPGVTVVNPHVDKIQQVALRPSPSADSSYAIPLPPPTVRTVEEIRSDVMGVFDSLPKADDCPELEPDERIQTPLLKHQRQALYFMINREKDDAPDANGNGSNPSWKRKTNKNGGEFYHNIITNQVQHEAPRPVRGGVLADMMGLGKTLSALSVITGTLFSAVEWARSAPVQPRAPEQKPSHPSRQFDVPKAQPFPLTTLKHNGKATLLICPLSTIANWEDQIKQHVKTDALRYHVYHGPNRIRDTTELSRFDIVITTYGSVSSELTARTKRKRGPHPLEEIGWFRIVLDEAHMIREQNTLAFKSVCRLQASRRWAVTGTPVQNKLEDLAALLAFLRLSPFDEKSKFLQYIILPFKNADPEIVAKLRVLVDPITIRRLKDKIDLPPRVDEIVRLEFAPDERRVYDQFAQNAKENVDVLTRQGQDRIIGGKTYIHILRAILRLRLICAHGKDLLNDEDMEVLQGMTAETAIDLDSDEDEDKPALLESKAYRHFELMKETDNDNCIKCGRKLGANEAAELDSERQEDILGYMTPCFHIYCPDCVKSFCDETYNVSWDSNAFGRCPNCLHTVKFSCVQLRHGRADMEPETQSLGQEGSKPGSGKASGDRYTGPHTKTAALVRELLANKEKGEMMPDEPPFKSVVFSGWTSHLDLIQRALDAVGITYTRLDGKMTRLARTAAIDAFREDPSVQIILVSITAGGLGLNLTAANSVFVMEPQYNPAAEAQAVDRIHRLGQKRPVRTVRFIMKDSFEEKMLELQDKKKKLASLSMNDRDKEKVLDRTEAARQRLLDLRSLFK